MANMTQEKRTNKTTDALLTKEEVAKRLKLCTRKVELMANAGEIPVIKIGTSIRYNWERVLEALENNQPQPN